MVLRSNQYEIFSLALNLAVINCEDSSNADETDRIGGELRYWTEALEEYLMEIGEII